MMLLMNFWKNLPTNTYAQLNDDGWKVSKDETKNLTKEEQEKLDKIQQYLAKHMRVIKLPQIRKR